MPAFMNPSDLKQLPLFAGLEDDDLDILNQCLIKTKLTAGQILMSANQPGDVAYIVLEGSVKITFRDDSNRAVILALLGPGEIVGEMSLVDRLQRSATVIAQEECRLLVINRSIFSDCLERYNKMTVALTKILSRRIRLANAQIQSLSTLDVQGRIARQLLTFAREYCDKPNSSGEMTIPVRLTQTDLAALVGATRVRVNQVIAPWRHAGYIRISADYRITVANPEKLEAFCI